MMNARARVSSIADIANTLMPLTSKNADGTAPMTNQSKKTAYVRGVAGRLALYGWQYDPHRHTTKTPRLRQQDIADRAGMARTTIVHIERGEYGVNLATLRALAQALDVSIWSLLKQAEDKDA